MKKLIRFISYILVAAVASAATFLLLASDSDPAEPSKLNQLEALILNRFIGDADKTAIEDAAAEAMVDALGDRWSYYIPAAEYAAYAEQMANSYVGIGITISTGDEGGGFTVLQVAAGSPAEESGILAGDIIAAVEGQDAAALGVDGARNLIRGEEGTDVSITISRDGQEQTLSVTRKHIQSQVTIGTLLEDNIGLVTIANFDSRCADETLAAIQTLLNQGAEALIFDVRNNPGGYKDELVEVLDYLLPEGPLFRTIDYRGVEEVDESDSDCLEIPMAVLVNGNSYSAAEFFAAALREYEAAIVVGEPTCGKGYFQMAFQMSDGSAVGLSVGKYFTPNGVSLADVGITPDVVVEVDEQTAFQIYAGTMVPEEDPQIQAAIAALTANP